MRIIGYLFEIVLTMSAIGTLAWLSLLALTPLLQKRRGTSAAYYARLAVLFCLLIPTLLLPLPKEEWKAVIPLPSPGQAGQDQLTDEIPFRMEDDWGTQPEGEPTAAGINWQETAGWLGIVWLAGAAALCGRRFRLTAGLARALRRTQHAPDKRTLVIYKRTAWTMGVARPPRLAISGGIGSPLLIGRYKPCVCLPEMELSEEELAAVFAHELTHFRRADLWVKFCVQLAVDLHWFNPAVWLFARNVDRLCELSCDEAVTGEMKHNEKKNYGRTILHVLAQSAEQRGGGALAFCTRSTRKNMEKRLNLIMESKKTNRRTVILIVCIVAALCLAGTGVALAFAPKAPEGPAESTDPTELTGNPGALPPEAPTPETVKTKFQEELSFDRESGVLRLTIPGELPEGSEINLFVSGRVPMGEEDMMSFHAFEEESANRSWELGKQYTYDVGDDSGKAEVIVDFALLDTVTGEELITYSANYADENMTFTNGSDTDGPASLNASEGTERFKAALETLSTGEGTTEGLIWPLEGTGTVAAPFGMNTSGVPHNGIDIKSDKDSSILAAHDGKVVFAEFAGSYGITVLIDRGDGIATFYAHCSGAEVKAGDTVKAGDVVATVGSTGRATGPHLHLTCLKNGTTAIAVSFPELDGQSE